MKMELAWKELLALLPEAQVEGQGPEIIKGIAALEEAGPEDLSFLGNSRYRRAVAGCKAGVLLLPYDYQGSPGTGQAYLRVAQPSLMLAHLCRHLEARVQPQPVPGCHALAVIGAGCQIDPSASVGPFCVIGEGSVIGARTILHSHVAIGKECILGAECILYPQVTVYARSRLGNRVIIHSGAVIGSDGFGYETHQGGHVKVPQIGVVVVEDDVEIGANTTIDRARFGETRIGTGSKIDNLVQIAHNVRIGAGSLIAAQAGIAGSTTLGKYVMVGGQAGFAGHIHIGDQSMIGAQAGVSKDYPPKSKLNGSPASPIHENYRVETYKRRLPELFRRLQVVETRLGLDGKSSSGAEAPVDS